MIKLFSTHCPRCKIVEMKLAKSGVDYKMIDDENEVISKAREIGIMSAPILQVDDKFYKFEDAIKYLNGAN